MKKSDCERLLGRKISREEFKNNRFELEEEASKKLFPIDLFDIDDDDDWLPEDELSIIDESDLHKMDNQ